MESEIIKAFVLKSSSYLDCEDSDDNTLVFSTRQHGDILNEEHSDKDFNEARRVKALLLQAFNHINVEIETVDEWVILNINPIKI